MLLTVLITTCLTITLSFAASIDARAQAQQDAQAETEAEAENAPGGTLVVLNKAEATASILERATGNSLATIETGEGPHEVAVSPDGKTAVVADYGAQTPGHTLTVIDLESLARVKTIDLKDYHRPHGIMYLPDGARIIVTCEQEQAVLIVNVETDEIVKTMDSGQRVTHMVALSPDASRAYAANIGSDSMCAFDLTTGERLATVATGPQAEGIDVAPDGKEIWVSNRQGNTVSIVDAESLEVTQTLDCPAFPIRVKFTPDGKHVLVSCARSGDVAVFNAAEKTIARRIAMDEQSVENTEDRLIQFEGSPVPIGILIPPDGRHAFIANTLADIVTVIDLTEWTVVDRYRAGKEPDGLGFSSLEH